METVRKRIQEDDDIHDQDRKLLNEYDVLLEADSIGDYYHAQLLKYLSLIASRYDAVGVHLSEILNSKDAVIKLLHWINRGEYYDKKAGRTFEFSERTKGHYRASARKFGRLINNGELPQHMEMIYGGTKAKLSATAPKPGEVLLWHEDIVPMIRASTNARDRAILAVAWDSGARPYELRDLTFGDISPDGDFVRITVGGKRTPLRDPRLVIASPFLKYWMEKEHPANNEGEEFTPETPIWTVLDDNQALTSRGFTNIIPVRVAPRTGVQKPTNLRQFRKSRASVLASRPEIGRGDLEERMGWTKGSKIVAVYVARFGSGSDNKISKSDGLPEEHLPDSDHEEFPDPAPVMCPTCSRWTPSYDEECIWCATSFDPTDVRAAEPAVKTEPEDKIDEAEKRRVKRDLMEKLTNGELTAANLKSAQDFEEVIRKYPELLDHADKLLDFYRRLRDDDDDDDNDDDTGVAPTAKID